jgi:catechol-2,3-dioxygenase
MMQFQIGEINVICSDIERSMHFYHEILGLDLVGREGRARRLCSDRTSILLLPTAVRPKAQEIYTEVPAISFDLVVKDLKSAYRHLYEGGVELDSPFDPFSRSFHVRDPDGLILEIVETDASEDERQSSRSSLPYPRAGELHEPE